jgi:gliding motility-associated-like protein
MNKPLVVLFLLMLCSFAGFGQDCTLNVTISSTANTICSGNKEILTANTTDGVGPFRYVWNTGENTPSISVNKAGTYTVTVSDNTPGCRPKVASISITAAVSPNSPRVNGQVVCPNTSATLTATAPGGTYQWYDASGKFLFSGNPYVTAPITQNTVFFVETTVGGCTSTRSSVNVSITRRPAIQADAVCYGTPATLIATGTDNYAWYADASGNGTPLSNNATFITPALTANTTYYLFTIVNGCTGTGIPVVARVNAPPAAPVVSANYSVCSGSSINLHADASGVVEWFTVPAGGTPLISSSDYTTPALKSSVTYYVQSRIGDCASSRVAVPVSVTALPAAPPSQSLTTCYGTSVTLTAETEPTGTYAWYNSPTGGTAINRNNSFKTPILTSNKTYYVEHTTGTCTSSRTPVTITVQPILNSPIVPDGPIICNGASATLSAALAGAEGFQWFTSATGGSPVSSDATFITSALKATTTYYVQATKAGCTSSRSAIKVTVLDALPLPVSPKVVVCSGSSATLTATGSPGDYEWYDKPSGGNLLITGDTYVTPALTASTNYYVQSVSNGCSGPRTTVTVQVNAPPTVPNITGNATVCSGQPASLSVPASGLTIQWFTTSTGGSPVYTGNSYVTNPLYNQTTFYAQAVNGSCVSPRKAFTVAVIPVINPQFQYPSGTVCALGSNVLPVINNPAGGSFSSQPGLVFKSNTSGEINTAASLPGKYTITYTYVGPCPGKESQSLTITALPDARFSYNGPFCTDMNNPLPVFQTGASAGVFSESSGKVIFKNSSTGEIDLTKSLPGTYTITNTIAASNTCSQSIATATVTIDLKVITDAGPDQTVQQGVPVQLAAVIMGGSSTGRWSGGAGTFSDPTNTTAVYTPAPGERSVKLTLTSDDPAGPCGVKTSEIIITINPAPASPTAPGKSVCIGSTASLVASAPGGTYSWYDSATGGTPLNVGPIFTTPPVLSNTTYYVETTIGGFTSGRTAVLVKASAIPLAPQVNQVSVCQGQPATLTASGSTGTYTWFDVPVGGSPVKQGNPFTTAVLSANRTYYVETTVEGCKSDRTKVDVLVTPAPQITSSGGNVICSGIPLNYTITADQPGATFSWERAAVAGISNTAVSGQTTNTITETLISTGSAAVDVTYLITPYLNGCTGPVFKYVVTVNAMPQIVSTIPGPVCSGTTFAYQIKFNTASTSFTWSRAEVPGIRNSAVSGQSSASIKEVLYNTTTAPIDVVYLINYATSTCTATPYELRVTVNPQVIITNTPLNSTVCNNTPLGLTLTSNVPSATYSWSRAAVTGISNPAVSNQTGNPFNEALINTTTGSVQAVYVITPMAFGCAGTAVRYPVIVMPQTLKPTANSNSPVCEGSDILLQTQSIAGAKYLWTGPNNYRSEDQNLIIKNATSANAGVYSLTLTINGCPGEPSLVPVQVNSPAIVSAGSAQQVCINVESVQLDGSIQSATGTGIWSGGTGTFSKQDDLKALYLPSAADRAAGTVTLTLTSTGKDDCIPVAKTVTVTFTISPGADAGPLSIDNVCSQQPIVSLSGKVFSGTTVKWTSASGLGKFMPSDNVLNPTFEPDPADINKGSVKLTLTATEADGCHLPTDDITINFVQPPTVQADAAGSTRYVLEGKTITLNPVVSSENVTYEWTPSTSLNNSNAKNPVVTGEQDITYQLKITDKLSGCVSYSQVDVKVSPVITVNNTFTPNGDGINDYWEIKSLVAYPNSTVNVYDRYGKLVFNAKGYPKPWDGTYQGRPLPSGTYYYVIDGKSYNVVVSGYVVILR